MNSKDVDLAKSLTKLRYRIIEVNSLSGEGHILSSLSVLEMIYAVVLHQRVSSPQQTNYPWRDPFVLSKGHAALALYVVLEEFGWITREELNGFGEYGSRFGGHADGRKFPLSYFSTGSLGHGLPVAVGTALQLQRTDPQAITYVICGDGEFMEGSIWESLFFAVRMRLGNIKILLDCNQTHTAMGFTREKLARMVSEVGCAVELIDGHDLQALNSALGAPTGNSPTVYLCSTRIGNGVNLVQGKKEWHRKAISPADLAEVKKQFGIQ